MVSVREGEGRGKKRRRGGERAHRRWKIRSEKEAKEERERRKRKEQEKTGEEGMKRKGGYLRQRRALNSFVHVPHDYHLRKKAHHRNSRKNMLGHPRGQMEGQQVRRHYTHLRVLGGEGKEGEGRREKGEGRREKGEGTREEGNMGRWKGRRGEKGSREGNMERGVEE
jgi:hypothetical protein